MTTTESARPARREEVDATWIADHTIEFQRVLDGIRSDEVIATGRRSFITGWWTFSIVRGERVWSGDDASKGIERTFDFINEHGVGR